MRQSWSSFKKTLSQRWLTAIFSRGGFFTYIAAFLDQEDPLCSGPGQHEAPGPPQRLRGHLGREGVRDHQRVEDEQGSRLEADRHRVGGLGQARHRHRRRLHQNHEPGEFRGQELCSIETSLNYFRGTRFGLVKFLSTWWVWNPRYLSRVRMQLPLDHVNLL